MTGDDRLDLSALAPDPERWPEVVAETLRRVDATLTEAVRADDPLLVIAAWHRRLLFAAAASLAILIPVEVMLERKEARQAPVERLVAASGLQGRATGADFLRALGRETP
jgi:hypothetical protein